MEPRVGVPASSGGSAGTPTRRAHAVLSGPSFRRSGYSGPPSGHLDLAPWTKSLLARASL